MPTITQNECMRCRTNCTPLANLISDDTEKDGKPASFICVGMNKKEDRQVKQDRFTLCWVNSAVDECGHWDKRDLLDTMSVISQALSIDENIRVNNGLEEKDMQEIDFQ